MTYSQVFIQKKEYLLCVSDGRIADVEDFMGWAEALILKAQQTGYARILIDNRTLILELSSLDIVTFAKFYEELGAAQFGLRFAALKSVFNEGTSRFVETSLTNRSASYKIFNTLDEAKEWLLV